MELGRAYRDGPGDPAGSAGRGPVAGTSPTPYRPDVQFRPLGESLCLSGSAWFLKQTEKGAGPRVAEVEGVAAAATVAGPAAMFLHDWTPARARLGADGHNRCEPGPAPWYYAGNILALAKSTQDRDSLFRTRFRVSKEWAGRMVRLYLGAVDYDAAFYLNGREVGRHEGHFAPVVLDVSKALLLWRRKRTDRGLGAVSAFAGHAGPLRNRTWRSQILKNMLTDCTPPACPLGISDDVFLLASRRLAIDDLCVRMLLNGDFSEAAVDMTLSLAARSPGKRRSSGGPAPQLRPALRRALRQIDRACRGKTDDCTKPEGPHPALWWPRGQGRQDLYTSAGDGDRQDGEPLDATGTTVEYGRLKYR